MFPLKRSIIALSAVALAACGSDSSVSPIAEFVDGNSAAITTGGTVVASYRLLVGQSVSIKPKTTTRTNRLKWSTSNSSVATVNSQGTVTARASGSATVQVSGTGVLENYAVAVSAPAAPTVTSFSLQPKTGVSLQPGQSQQFQPTATWSDGFQYPLTVTYAATGGTISGTGLFTAGSVAGTFMVIATCACSTPAIADTALVSVVVPQLTSLTVSPKTASVAAGATQQFGVTATWSTGATTVPPVTWSATGGTVSSTGLYTAPTTAGTYRVIVAHTNGTVRDTATVTVNTTSSGGATSFPTAAWSVAKDFNGGVLGQSVNRTASGFDDAGGGTLFANDRVFEGAMSGRMQIDSASDGWGQWGGVVQFPSRLVQGDEIWLDLYVYLPAGFTISTSPGWLKFLRLTTKTAAGSNSGYNDVYLCNDGRTDCQFGLIKEIQDTWFTFGAPGSFTRDRWHRISMHLRYSSVPRANGGTSQVRVWQNGVLLINEQRVQTLTNATDYSDAFFLFTYWNGTSPKRQTAWVDNIRLANRQPAWASDLQSVNNY